MKDKILHIPSLEVFDDNIDLLFSFLARRGYPKWSYGRDITLLGNINGGSLMNLVHVKGDVTIELSNIRSLGELTNIDGSLSILSSELVDMGKLWRE